MTNHDCNIYLSIYLEIEYMELTGRFRKAKSYYFVNRVSNLGVDLHAGDFNTPKPWEMLLRAAVWRKMGTFFHTHRSLYLVLEGKVGTVTVEYWNATTV